MFVMRCLACGCLVCVISTVARELTESDVYLGTEHFTASEQANMELLYRWLDDIFWSELWDGQENRRVASAHLEQLAQLGETLLPSLAFPVAQAFYSYFWFKDNGPNLGGVSLSPHACHFSVTPLLEAFACVAKRRVVCLSLTTS